MQLSELVKYAGEVPQANLGDVLAINSDSYHWVPDGAVDLVLTDPPFNIARDTIFTHTRKTRLTLFVLTEKRVGIVIPQKNSERCSINGFWK